MLENTKAHIKSAAQGVGGAFAGVVGTVVGFVSTFFLTGGDPLAATYVAGAAGPTAIAVTGLIARPPKVWTYVAGAVGTLLLAATFNAATMNKGAAPSEDAPEKEQQQGGLQYIKQVNKL